MNKVLDKQKHFEEKANEIGKDFIRDICTKSYSKSEVYDFLRKNNKSSPAGFVEFCISFYSIDVSHFRSRKHTEETKKLLSEKRKKYLKENPKSHSWSKFRNKETEPEKRLAEFIAKLNKFQVHRWYKIPESDKFFEIDFAMPELKIAIEVNGEQHYNRDGSLAEYYQKRDDCIKSLGRKTLQIHYILCFNESKLKEIFDELICSIDENDLSSLELKLLESGKQIINAKEARKQEKLIKREEALKRKKVKPLMTKRVFKHLKEKRILAKQEKENAILENNEVLKKKLEELLLKYGNEYGYIALLMKELNTSHSCIRRLLKKLNLYKANRKLPKKNMAP